MGWGCGFKVGSRKDDEGGYEWVGEFGSGELGLDYNFYFMGILFLWMRK